MLCKMLTLLCALCVAVNPIVPATGTQGGAGMVLVGTYLERACNNASMRIVLQHHPRDQDANCCSLYCIPQHAYVSAYKSMTYDADTFWDKSKEDKQMVKDIMNLEAQKANRANSEFASNRAYDSTFGAVC